VVERITSIRLSENRVACRNRSGLGAKVVDRSSVIYMSCQLESMREHNLIMKRYRAFS